MKNVKTIEVNGQTITLETGDKAQMANGSVWAKWGNTVVLCTATLGLAREGVDFFPLTCDYEAKMYAAGKMPGGFMRREGRSGIDGILASRLIDRSIRPLFPKIHNDVQIVATVMSADMVHDPAILALIGSGAALSISDIPFDGPIAAVRIGLIEAKLVVNPDMPSMMASQLDLVVAGTKDAIVMVEAGADEISEDIMLQALDLAHTHIRAICLEIAGLAALVGKPKLDIPVDQIGMDILSKVHEFIDLKLDDCLYNPNKQDRSRNVDGLREEILGKALANFTGRSKEILVAIEQIIKDRVRANIVEKGLRVDGRKVDEIRKLSAEVDLLPAAHGSGMFTRGQTQVLSVVTLAGLDEQQKIDGLGLAEFKRYMHQYNFPPYSTGEAKPLRGPGRREIGHGALAERALLAVLPNVQKFPYAIRVVSEVLSSNGSTSMASVCASSLALMDAGVDIKSPVAGMAMGLVQHNGKTQILTDIQGVEDALGDMDFKVAGTSVGITAIQMDIKIKGLSREILQQALEQARQARNVALGTITDVMARSASKVKPHAPHMTMIQIDKSKIGKIIGTGGKQIRQISEETKTKVSVDDEGLVTISSAAGGDSQKALEWIQSLTVEVEIGKTYEGKIVRIEPFGAFVEIMPGKDGLVHISKLDRNRVERVEDIVHLGDKILVKATEVDAKGRLALSRRAVIDEIGMDAVLAQESV